MTRVLEVYKTPPKVQGGGGDFGPCVTNGFTHKMYHCEAIGMSVLQMMNLLFMQSSAHHIAYGLLAIQPIIHCVVTL